MPGCHSARSDGAEGDAEDEGEEAVEVARVATIGTHADVAPALSRPRTARTETLCMTPREPSFARVIRSIICRRSRDSYRPSERLESVYPYDVKLYLRRLWVGAIITTAQVLLAHAEGISVQEQPQLGISRQS